MTDSESGGGEFEGFLFPFFVYHYGFIGIDLISGRCTHPGRAGRKRRYPDLTNFPHQFPRYLTATKYSFPPRESRLLGALS